MTAEAPTAELASNYCSPRATSNARSSCPGLSDWFCRPDNDDFVLRSLLCSCSNVALRAQGLYCATDSPFIPRACPDCASGCLHISYGKLRDCRTRDLKTSTHLAHGTRKAAHGGREGKSSLVRGARTRLGEGEFLREKSLYRRM